MMNFKVLGTHITKAGLWGKPLNEFSEEEILKLAGMIIVAQLEQEKTCGDCWYAGWKARKPWCLHSDHPGWIAAFSWGYGCQDWSYLCDKEFGPHKLNRRQKVNPDVVDL